MTDQQKTAIIHARVSDRKQAEKEVSIPAQIEAGHKCAEDLDAKVLHVFTEGTARSAWRGNRPELEDAIRFCEINKVDFFITWDTSRFSRNSVNGPINRHRVRAAGTFIKYITVDIDPETTDGFVLETIYQMKDELKSRDTSRDTMRGMIANAKQGYWNGGRPPFGFMVVPDIDNPKRKRLTPHPDEKDACRKIFELKANKGLGAKSIALWLNDNGYKNRGARWNKTVIGYLLKNETVRGKSVFGRTNRATGKQNDRSRWIIVDSHEAIISDDLWKRTQKRLQSDRNNTDSGSPNSSYIFTGLLTCGECGSPLHITSSKGRSKRYWYYICSNVLKNRKHKARRISARDLDSFLVADICSTLFNSGRLIDVAQEIGGLCNTWDKDQSKKIIDIDKKIKKLKERQRNLFDVLELHGTDTPNLSDLTSRLRSIKDELTSLSTNRSVLENETPPQFQIKPEDLVELGSLLTGIIKTMDSPKKARDFFQLFIDKILIKDKIAVVEYHPLKLMTQGGAVLSKAVWLPGTGSNRRPND